LAWGFLGFGFCLLPWTWGFCLWLLPFSLGFLVWGAFEKEKNY
jgi:hypothetical protein